MAISKTTRWLDLIAFLLYRHSPVTREDIFANVRGYREAGASDDAESRRRKFERDKDDLRGLGLAIETVDLPHAAGGEPDKGYRLPLQGFYMPYLELVDTKSPAEKPYRGLRQVKLSKADLQRIDRGTRRIAEHEGTPLAAAAASVRHKMAFDLPIPMQVVERVLAEPMEGEAGKALDDLQRAVVSRTAVRCAYYAISRDEEAQREIEPYGLFFNWGKWYCVGLARDRDALRVFRVDRVRQTRLISGAVGKFDVPEGFTIQDYVGRAPWELSETKPLSVKVKFRFPVSRWVQNRQLGTVLEAVGDDGSALIEFAVTDSGPFLRWLLTYRDRAEVVRPPAVAKELAGLRQQVAALYADTDAS